MYIRRIAARNFRKFDREVMVDDIGEGLTVIVGDNEEGKSTLLKAVQAALFERHSRGGKTVDDMLPSGQSVRPEVEVDFDMGAGVYRLRKGFAQKPSAELDGPEGRWQDDAAEDKLQDLLGFTPAQGRASSDERHRGLAGLLWVEQGRAFAPLGMNDESHHSLTEAISAEVGDVLGGERGRKLLAAAEKKRLTYFTKGRSQPTGDLKKREHEVVRLTDEIGSVRSDLKEYEDDVERLEGYRRNLADLENPETLKSLKEKQERAEQEQTEVDGLKDALVNAKTGLELAESNAKMPHSQWQSRQGLIADVQTAKGELSNIQDNLNGAIERHGPLVEDEARKRKARDSRKDALGKADAIFNAALQASARARLTRDVNDLSGRLEKAEAAEKQAVRLDAQGRAIKIDEKEIKKLRSLTGEVEMARATLDGAATAVDFAPKVPRAVTVGGVPVALDIPLRVTEETELALEGFGQITVKPGGGDLADRRAGLEAADNNLTERLQKVGAGNLEEAEDLARKLSRLKDEAAAKRREIDIHAPEGLPELRQATALKMAELADMDQGATGPALDIASAQEEEGKAERARKEAESAFERADGAWQRATTALTASETERAGLDGEVRNKGKEVTRLEERLESSRAEISDADLEAAVALAKEEVKQAQEKERRASQALDNADPEGVALALNAAKGAVEAHKKTLDDLREKVGKLEGKLDGLGQRGLGEELQRLEGEYEAAVAERDRIWRDAEAWRLLHDTLAEAERGAKETFMGPIRDRVRPYLRRLFPDSEIELDDANLEITHLTRAGRAERFDQLSLGTREQIAVLTRFAFADLLREAGQPISLILDDPLVNTDDPRFERMERALLAAAQNVQLIVLTCHAKRYRGLGAPMIQLVDCGAGV